MQVIKRSWLEKSPYEAPTNGAMQWLGYIGRALSGYGAGMQGRAFTYPFVSQDQIVETYVHHGKWWETGTVGFALQTLSGKIFKFRIPTGVVNNKDTKRLGRILYGSDHAGAFMLAIAPPIKRMHDL